LNILLIGSRKTTNFLGEQLLKGKVDKISFVDNSVYNYLNWDIAHSEKVNFFSGNIQEINTLIKSGLDDADIVIVDSGDDTSNLFIGQKAKINFDTIIFVILEDLSVSEVFESIGLKILNSHDLKVKKILNEIEKF